jgi:CDP-diacylglycerol--glycerol-3-phosphate 3-phosphatidyltransferase
VRLVEVGSLLAAGVLLATMPVFAIVRRGRGLDAEVAKRPTTIILGYWIRDWLMWVIQPIERGLIRLGVSPDALNLTGAVFGAAAGVAFAVHQLSLAGWFVLLGGAADIFDGRIARALGIASSRGAFIDSSLDRFAEMFAFVGLAAMFTGQPWRVAAVTMAMGASMLVSYTRARGEGLGINHRGGVMQRAERLVLLGVGAIFDTPLTSALGWSSGSLLAIIVIIIAAGALGTAIYRTVQIADQLRKRDG